MTKMPKKKTNQGRSITVISRKFEAGYEAQPCSSKLVCKSQEVSRKRLNSELHIVSRPFPAKVRFEDDFSSHRLIDDGGPHCSKKTPTSSYGKKRGSYGGVGAAYGFVNDHCSYQEAGKEVDIVRPSVRNATVQYMKSPKSSALLVERLGTQDRYQNPYELEEEVSIPIQRPITFRSSQRYGGVQMLRNEDADSYSLIGEPLLAKECMTPTEVCHLLVFPEILPRHRVCHSVPQGYKLGDATFIINNADLKSVDDISCDGLGSWKRPSGKTRYLEIVDHDGKKARFLDKDGRIDPDTEYHVRVVRSRSENKNAKLARAVFKAFDAAGEPMPYSAITYHWTETPHDFDILPHGNSKKANAKPFQPKPRSFLNELRILKNMSWEDLEGNYDQEGNLEHINEEYINEMNSQKNAEESILTESQNDVQDIERGNSSLLDSFTEEVSTEIVVPSSIHI